jgi:hypothetical protein
MKQFITLMLALAFLTTATASTGATVGLSQAINELNYTLNVDWDQQDQAFREKAMEKFRAQLHTLKMQGLSNQELIQGSLAMVRDEGLKTELMAAYAIIDANRLTAEEAQRVVVNAAEKARAQGASWVGGSSAFQWIGIAIAVALVIAVFSGGSGDSTPCTENCPTYDYQCGYQHVCGWGYDYWGTYSYNCDYQYVCGYYYW